MEEIIKGWGTPGNLEGEFEYKFGGNSKSVKDLQYRTDISYSFCLIDKSNNKEVIVVDFYTTDGFLTEKSVKIEILYVPYEEYRNLGLATFVVEKIIEFASLNGINLMKLTVNPLDEIFAFSKGVEGPTKKELISFYKSFEASNFKIEILND
ncbi:hypothetical protein G7061_04275 [Erysipelothrix sp. HDW6B]|uniref:hypothetical protein n=1 Tax=Erysipelothrix TaxID=1647 RepID=UPI00135B1CF2|nr:MULTISPECIES: hypothetical protein [Erysipelothrix]QIK85869.1 hypothetical protein G7061_04275 [Erysipelothrix sp. HDW6B]